MNFLRKIIKNKVVRNAGWLLLGRIIRLILSFFVGILTARYLGPANEGLISYAGAYTGFFVSLCVLGINSVLLKEFVDFPERQGEILGSSLMLRVVSGFLSSVLITCITVFVDYGKTDVILIVSLCSLELITQVFELFDYWFQAKLLSKYSAIASLFAYVMSALYRVILLVKGASVACFAVVGSVSNICELVILVVCYKKTGGEKLTFSYKYCKELLKKSYHYILPSVMVAVYAQTDKLMIQKMIGDTENGYYSIAVTIATMWCFILTAIIDSMHPSIMQSFKNNDGHFRSKNVLLYAIVFYLSISVAVIFFFFSEPVVVTLYGSAYRPAVNVLRIVVWYVAFSYLGVARNAWIVCNNCQRYLKYVYIMAAVCNVVLNAILIPRYQAQGAATATLITQIITIFGAPVFIPEMRENVVMMVDAIRLKGFVTLIQSER